MIEYAVRSHSAGGTAALERELDHMASGGWRLVSTAAAAVGMTVQVFMFFERDTGQRERQDEWRTQHGEAEQ